jgi:hypothetical protein
MPWIIVRRSWPAASLFVLTVACADIMGQLFAFLAFSDRSSFSGFVLFY